MSGSEDEAMLEGIYDYPLQHNSTAKLYHNIRITCDSGFDVIAYANKCMITDKLNIPYMIAKHVHGKRGGHHWHVAGILKGKHGCHLPRVTKITHPVAGKPIQCLRKTYDVGTFRYCIKPREYAHADCIVATNISEADIETLAYDSANKHDEAVGMITGPIESFRAPEEGEAFNDYYFALMQELLQITVTAGCPWQPQYKNRILLKIWELHPQYRANIARYLM